ncbi:MFS transporter [Streptomyces europaeiscabiei]|uniref:MFS transporter n=1 Tax=Streptomyces europaeiscabiei TaxID=146819 RepID=UPI0029BAA562|nr:MFS transporter [Streptomyces europaeiscabiei]MDX3615289.1 MFS transporter [Streptomyces europaeiscabiei]
MVLGLAGMVAVFAVFAVFVAFTAFTAFGAGRSAPWVVVGCLTVVLREILFVPSFDIWVTRKVPADRLAKAMGAMHFFRGAGSMIGSLPAGILFGTSLSWDMPGANWYVAALIAAGCVFVCLFSRDEEPAEGGVDTTEQEREEGPA